MPTKSREWEQTQHGGDTKNREKLLLGGFFWLF